MSTRKQQLTMIAQAFSRLSFACESTHDWDRYLAIVRQEETEHRRFKPDGVRAGLTRAQSVQLFAVKEVFDCFVPNESGKVFTPEAKDFLHVRTSVYAAHSIAFSCREQIEKEFTREEMAQWLKAVDYVELNKAA